MFTLHEIEIGSDLQKLLDTLLVILFNKGIINYVVETEHRHCRKRCKPNKDCCSHLKVISLHQEQEARNKANQITIIFC